MALDMNYTPTRLVDITTLTEDQWLDWRKKGIGGSDVAAALNMKSPGDLAWYVKNYSGHNLALKAGAIKLLEAAGQMAS